VRAHTRLVRRLPHDLVLIGSDHKTFGRQPVPNLETVRIIGYVPDADLNGLVTGAAASLFPTRLEGFGLPPLEALRCGVPAIVSDIPVLRESTRGEAHFVAHGDPDAWTAAMEMALRGQLAPGRAPSWTWGDAADRLLLALQPIL
jgi:glycosyltransferase involved in cell wall biosynthesis